MSEALLEAINEAVDARLKEHGLLEEEKKGSKGSKGSKGKSKEDDEVTFDKLKEAFVELVNEKGKDAAKKVLKGLKVEKLTEVEESDYEEALAAIQKANGGKAKGKEEDDDLFGDD